MRYNGRDVNLEEYMKIRKEMFNGKPEWMWKDEGALYSILDYACSCELTPEDIRYLKNEHGLDCECVMDFIQNEQ